MKKQSLNHLITGEELDKTAILTLLDLALAMKKNPSAFANSLNGKHIALIFEKPSLRTRLSFTVGIHQLGGHVIESVATSRKKETPEDFMRVIQGYCDGVMIRTDEDSDLTKMAQVATIPIINGLTDLFHPCQALADLFTLKTCFHHFNQLKIAYVGDGNNVLHSLLMLATQVGIEVHYTCPKSHGPNQHILKQLLHPHLAKAYQDPKEAVKDCQAVYTDVWTSMGFETKNEADFNGFQVNEALMSLAHPDAIFMHCMPMERGKEVSHNLPDAPNAVIFQQSQNRLFVQKALLVTLLTKGE